MQTILTGESNGLNVVIGFSKAILDPEATRVVIDKLLSESGEAASIEVIVGQIKSLIVACEDLKKSYRVERDAKIRDSKYTEWLQRLDEIKIKEGEISALIPSLRIKRQALTESNAEYFHPKRGEFIATDDHVLSVKNMAVAILDNECVCVDEDLTCSKVSDFRSKYYWIKSGSVWSGHLISMVNSTVPDGGILDSDLTADQKIEIKEQLDNERIAKLSVGERSAELVVMSDKLLANSAFMRSQLEIQGVTTALEDSQTWYNTELAKLQTKYS